MRTLGTSFVTFTTSLSREISIGIPHSPIPHILEEVKNLWKMVCFKELFFSSYIQNIDDRSLAIDCMKWYYLPQLTIGDSAWHTQSEQLSVLVQLLQQSPPSKLQSMLFVSSLHISFPTNSAWAQSNQR